MFTNLVQNWRNTSWEKCDLTSESANRKGVGNKVLVMKGSGSPYSMDNIGNGRFIESMSYFYYGPESSAQTIIKLYFRGDQWDVFSSPDQQQEYNLVAELAVSTTSPDQIQPLDLFVPPWAWLYAATSDGDKWAISFTGLDSDWVYNPNDQGYKTGSGAVTTYTGLAWNTINIKAVPPTGSVIISL